MYELDKVQELFRRTGITGIVATSRPNKARTSWSRQGAWAVGRVAHLALPGARRHANLVQDPPIFDLIQDEYKRGYYRGIGEFHIYGRSADSPWMKKTVDSSVGHDLYLHAHCDGEGPADPVRA